MKVILFENMSNLGLPGDIVEVRPGYYRNYLQPRGAAVEATPQNLKMLELKRNRLREQAEKLRKDAESVGGRLQNVTLNFELKAGANDRLFGSVTSIDIHEKLEALGFELDRRQIVLTTPLKTTGTHPVRVRLSGNVTANINVVVTAEARPDEEEPVLRRRKKAEPAPAEAAAEGTEETPAAE